MSATPKISFAKPGAVRKGAAVLLSNGNGALSRIAATADPAGTAERAVRISGHKGRLASLVEVLAPEGSAADRIIVVGTGKPEELSEENWLKIGGAAFSKVKNAGEAAVFLDNEGTETTAADAANFALGMVLRSYSFDKYKTKKKEENNNGNGGQGDLKSLKVRIFVPDPGAARKEFAGREAISGGVMLARDLVNEPANILGPVEFGARAKELEKLGVTVQILTEKELKKLGMGALLGVAQGSVRPPRLAVMQWKGGKAKDKPVAFVGKGVVFDTGGISIKPAAGMEDMKGDMGGAAAVAGVIHALAARKAKVNAVGVIGLVENMPDGNAQRPGDIVTSMSGQTIEVLNTDAEGRLVLADALWYCNNRFKPVAMINLATLTGAIMVALGNDHAGMFSNNDKLAGQLTGAGLSTGEKVWRMPLGKAYDKLIDSKNADMKNIGGRFAGAITAAQFLQRFVGETPWAHLDVAGTAMSSPSNEYNQSWASGFGVRLLERYVRDNFE